MNDLIILHTNDIHGRVEGLSRIASLVERIRAENREVPVLYFDLGDSEDTSERLSNLTKGASMHRLLGSASQLRRTHHPSRGAGRIPGRPQPGQRGIRASEASLCISLISLHYERGKR